MASPKTIGILTSGGDCPGLNAAIRGVGKTAISRYGMKVYGFINGFQGLISKDYRELTDDNLSGILTMGGTILGTSREKPFKHLPGEDSAKKPEQMLRTIRALKLDCVVCIGGNGTMKTAWKLAQEGIKVIGIPKTIDNDVWGTDLSFGFDSAVQIATEAIDRLHTTANSHRRIMVVEVMGHGAGWLALHAGIAGGGDIILIPEIAWDENKIAQYLKRRAHEGKAYSIVVVAEGIRMAGNVATNRNSSGLMIAERITRLTGLETRETVLGYIQRGGSPSPTDRILATRLGTAAASLIAEGNYNRMVALQANDITSIPLQETAGLVKTIPLDHPMLREARLMGTCFGD